MICGWNSCLLLWEGGGAGAADDGLQRREDNGKGEKERLEMKLLRHKH